VHLSYRKIGIGIKERQGVMKRTGELIILSGSSVTVLGYHIEDYLA